MGDQQNGDLVVQIARFGEQLRNVAASVEDIKLSVKPVAALDRAIAEMSIHNQNARKDIELLWARVDAGRTEREALGDELGAQIDGVDERVAAMKNTARGAMWVLGIVLGVVQTFLVGSIV